VCRWACLALVMVIVPFGLLVEEAKKTAIGQMAVGVADDAGRLVCDLEDREIPIGFAGSRAGVAGRRDLQSISCCSSRSKAAVLQEGCGSEKKGTKDAEQEESSVNGR